MPISVRFCNNAPFSRSSSYHSIRSNVYFLHARHGHFRDAWLFEAESQQQQQDFVYKRLRERRKVDYWDVYRVEKDAIVMERLTASPRIVDIYGYCSTTILSEAMGGEVWTDMVDGSGYVSQSELDQQPFGPKNNFTAVEKLKMALDMTEALAYMRGYAEGVLLHGDTHPEQWLRARDGTLKLNDFNNAQILDYDGTNYCKLYRNFGGF